jgi:hypothetical protein
MNGPLASRIDSPSMRQRFISAGGPIKHEPGMSVRGTVTLICGSWEHVLGNLSGGLGRADTSFKMLNLLNKQIKMAPDLRVSESRLIKGGKVNFILLLKPAFPSAATGPSNWCVM